MRNLFRILLFSFAVAIASAGTIIDTGAPDGRMAAASQPSISGTEIEAADDFLLNTQAFINSGTFTGLITGATPSIGEVAVEIYRVFPLDSTFPPSGNVPTRVNSPSDNQFASGDSSTGTLTFSTTTLNVSFTAANSVLNGINKSPNQATGGEGPVTGQEVQFSFNLSPYFNLPADHYFFVPQVQVTGGQFYWLSSPRPDITTVFAPDLQAWIRNAPLDPDWLRIGTDIVGGGAPPQFNMSFSLNATPEPSTVGMFGAGLLALGLLRKRRS